MKSILSNIFFLLISIKAFAGFSWEEVYESNNCLVPCYIRHKNNCMLVLRTKDDIYPYLAECGYINNKKNNEIIFSAENPLSKQAFKNKPLLLTKVLPFPTN